MNRRQFIKTVGVVSLMGTTSLLAGEKEQQWIRYADIMPEVGEKVILLHSYKGKKTICYGEVLRSNKYDINIRLNIRDDSFDKKMLKLDMNVHNTDKYLDACGYNGIRKNRPINHCYWLPIKNKLPNKLPKFNK